MLWAGLSLKSSSHQSDDCRQVTQRALQPQSSHEVNTVRRPQDIFIITSHDVFFKVMSNSLTPVACFMVAFDFRANLSVHMPIKEHLSDTLKPHYGIKVPSDSNFNPSENIIHV